MHTYTKQVNFTKACHKSVHNCKQFCLRLLKLGWKYRHNKKEIFQQNTEERETGLIS